MLTYDTLCIFMQKGGTNPVHISTMGHPNLLSTSFRIREVESNLLDATYSMRHVFSFGAGCFRFMRRQFIPKV
jgi:hypothetical protein